MRSHTANRALIAAILGLAGGAAGAAEPAEGTLTDTSGPLSWTAGPFVLPNPTPQLGLVDQEPVCEPDTTTCDIFTLTVTFPDGYSEAHPDDTVEIQVEWDELPASDPTGNVSAPDFDVYLYEGDKQVASDAGGANPERIRLPVFNGTRTFEVRVITFAPAGQSIRGSVKLEKLEAQSGSSGLLAAGSTGLAALLTLGLAGLGRRFRRTV